MPGRQGAMRYKRNKSRRQRPDEMETTLKDSIHNSRRKEQSILRQLIAPRLQPVKKTAIPMHRPGEVKLSTKRELLVTKSRKKQSWKKREAEAAQGGNAAGPSDDVSVPAVADEQPDSHDLDPTVVLQRLAALRQQSAAGAMSTSADAKLLTPLVNVDWVSKRDTPAPDPQLDERRKRTVARRQERAEKERAAQERAAERRGERRAAARAAAEAAAAEEEEEEDQDDADLSPMDRAKRMVQKLPSVGKKEAARTAFKVLAARKQAKELSGAQKKKSKMSGARVGSKGMSSAPTGAQLKSVAGLSSKAKKRGAGKGGKGGKGGKKPARARKQVKKRH